MGNTKSSDVMPMLLVILAIILFIAALAAIPLIIVFSVLPCIALHRTRKWQQAKNKRICPESTNLVTDGEADAESELDPDDSDYENELKFREEERMDLKLSFGQKFRKEMALEWKGNKARFEREQKRKERKERRKLAKQVAKEMIKMERIKQKRTAASEGEADQFAADGAKGHLPSYYSATTDGED